VEILLERHEVPPGLIRFFEPVRESDKRDVWRIPTKGYKQAHFATFPPALVTPCILAGTSAEGVCPDCGAPWERVVELGDIQTTGGGEGREASGSCLLGRGNSNVGRMTQREHLTTGWRPTCEHDTTPIPATVLDPFCGSGTVGEVCNDTQRKFVGLDLSSNYLRELALPRAENKSTMESIQELPMFAE